MTDREQEQGADTFTSDQERKEWYDQRIAWMRKASNNDSMLSYSLQKKHEQAIEILQAIEHYENQRDNVIQDKQGWMGQIIPERLNHNIDIYTRCIERLWSRYNKLMSKI